MSAIAPAENVKPLPAVPKLQHAQAYLRGRIFSRRKISTQDGPLWLTVIRTPARDQFSHPSTIEVRSKSPIGGRDDDWEGVVEISGFPRSYNTKPDEETGEIGRVHTAEIRLTVAE